MNRMQKLLGVGVDDVKKFMQRRQSMEERK